MTNSAIANLSLTQLKQAVSLREQIDSLQTQLGRLLGGAAGKVAAPRAASLRVSMPRSKGQLSAAGRAAIARAQKARWAKIKAGKASAPTAKAGTKRKKANISAAGRAAIAAAQRARWAKIKAAKAKAGK